jgi:ABC-type branched-subunit amino acid transport system substrate-binding protein
MPDNTFVCPYCSGKNPITNTRCAQCNIELSNLPPVITTAPPANAATSRPANQQHLPLSGPPSMKRRGRTNSQRRNWRTIIMLIVIIIFIPSFSLGIFLIIKNVHDHNNATATPSPTHIAVPLHLPNGLGEAITPAGQSVGVNDGSFAPFDIGRSTLKEKQEAAKDLAGGNTQGAIASWHQALFSESNDAETLIYLEDQRVIASGKPYVTLVAGTAFTPPYSGTQDETGLQGIYVAQHEFNIGSHPFWLRVLIANSGSNVNNTAAVAHQIVQVAQQDTTVVGVIGWLNSSNTLNALNILTEAKIPIISPQASSDYLTGISSYFFRVVSPNKFQAQAAILLMKNLHVTHPVVFVDPGNVYSQNLAQDFEAQFAPNGHLPEVDFKTEGGNNFPALIQKALQKNPGTDAFYFTSANANDAGLFQDALPTGKYANILAIGGDGGYTIHPNSYGRWYFTEYAYHGESYLPIAEQFAQEYTADFDPGPHPQKPDGTYDYSLANEHAILAYDSASVVLSALVMADSNGNTTLTPQVLANTLPTITEANAFQGVSGQIAFGPDHDPINKAIVILYASEDGHTQLYNIQGCLVKGCA